MPNIYYDTIEGLTRVGELDEPNLSYEYNMLIVLQHTPSGRLFWAKDSGCSCPTPFEDYYFKSPDDNDLQEITPGDSLTEFTREVDNFPDTFEDRNELITKVKRLLVK